MSVITLAPNGTPPTNPEDATLTVSRVVPMAQNSPSGNIVNLSPELSQIVSSTARARGSVMIVFDCCRAGNVLGIDESLGERAARFNQVFIPRGYSVHFSTSGNQVGAVLAELTSFLSTANSGDLCMVVFEGHGGSLATELSGTRRDMAQLALEMGDQDEDFSNFAGLWGHTVRERAQSGSTIATVFLDQLSNTLAGRTIRVEDLSNDNARAGDLNSDGRFSPARHITIPAPPQNQQTEQFSYEIQLPETPEYYSDSIELLSIALDSISEIIGEV
ncbi:hypothetical protein FRC12_003192 [Ceratobasidium sp. 428]|nr:hypothetical protein FRC09_018065 [Ceratobasidium sp. 395]KAG8772242.1 hypothetical protein FRC12_003192 [Ceratobasidium sp. 428]